MKTFIFVACAFLFASCQSESGVTQAPKPPPLLDEQPKAEFVERYKFYRCAESEVPVIEESQGSGERLRAMQFGEHLVLKLELGKLVCGNGDTSGPMRTKSRYRLFWDGKQVGEAESLFSTKAGYDSPEPQFFYNSESQSLLIFEELTWSTKRCIIFEGSLDSNASKKCMVKYVRPPARPRHYLSANSEDGRIRGIGNGKLYLEMDGLLYAFPFNDFLETKLEFTVG